MILSLVQFEINLLFIIILLHWSHTIPKKSSIKLTECRMDGWYGKLHIFILAGRMVLWALTYIHRYNHNPTVYLWPGSLVATDLLVTMPDRPVTDSP